MYRIRRRKLYSQNFLYSRKLVSHLLGRSSIGKNDLVLEIGPGKGIITEQLAQKARHVLAVEVDFYWYRALENTLKACKNVTVYHADFLNYPLPALPYKVFANIPFSIEGKIIRKLLESKNPPEDTYIVVMKKLGYRLSAPYKDNMFSVIHKPWFDFSIDHHFKRTDFFPMPSVDAVMLRFQKRHNPKLSWTDRFSYQKFIAMAYTDGLPVWRNLKRTYGHRKAAKALGAAGISRAAKPREVSFAQWRELYEKVYKKA